MKKFAVLRTAAAALSVTVILICSIDTGGQSRPQFYIATDKSFGKNETPYINLEGVGTAPYEFRVYKIENPVQFIKKSVKERLVTEQNDTVFGDPIAIFKMTLQHFKKDFRAVARKEFNYKTRSQLKKSLGVDYDKPDNKYTPALVGLIKDHKLILSFSIPAGDGEWTYRRVPIPVPENGMFLVEGVSGSNIGHTLVVKSGINFVTKQSEDQTLIFAARKDSGEPLASARVVMLDGENGAEIQRGSTSSEGVLEISSKPTERSLIIVDKDGEFAISDPNYYARSFYGRGGYRAYIYTERPIYKPGDEVAFKGIIRRFDNDRYYLTGGQCSIRVSDTEGKTIIEILPSQVSGEMGTFSGSFTLPKDNKILLGVYNLTAQYNGESYSTEFTVEAYRKPEFLVRVKTPKKTYIGNESIPVTVSARYYYGQQVKDAEYNVKVFRSKKYDYSPVGQVPYFIIEPEYLGLQSVNRKREMVLEKSGKLNDNGMSTFNIDGNGDLDDDYTYTVIASVRSLNSTLSGTHSFSINRSEFYIKLSKGSSVYGPGESAVFDALLNPFDSALTGAARQKITSGKKVKAILYSRKFKNIAEEDDRDKIGSVSAVTDISGKARFTFKVPAGGHYILECSAEDNNGKETIARTAFWASEKSDSIQVPFKNLTLQSKKDIYSVGENAEVLILTPASDGTLFVTLEANNIIRHSILKVKGNTCRYSFKIEETMSPNCVISVLQFAGNEVYQNQLKIVAPPLHKFISVGLKPDKAVYAPGETASVSITTTGLDKKGIRAEVSVAVVDEAIYQLQEDKNPPITTYFYHPRRNNVNTTLSNAYRFFGYSEAKRLQLALARKGNSPLSAIKEEDRSRENYKDTCYWSARVTTDASGKAKVTFPLSENITTWRVSAVAVTTDTKVGQGKTSFIARKDLMMTAAIPSYILKGEKQLVAAHVSNLSREKLKADITIQCKNISVSGASSGSVEVSPGEVKQVYFTLIAAKNSSDADCQIDLQARSGRYFDGSKQKIPLRNFGVERNISSSIKVDDGQNREITLNVPQNAVDRKIEIRLSPGFGEGLRQSLPYLVDYPYGCVEQTMSRFMPLLAAKKAGYIDQSLLKNIPQMVSQGLSSLAGHQKEDGGFGWYGEQGTNSLMTAYVYRGLALCKRLYGQTNTAMMTNARKYLYSYISENDPGAFERAYILAALSEGGEIEKSMVDRLLESAGKQTAYSKALTSLVLINSGMAPEAAELFASALKQSGLGGSDEFRFPAETGEWSTDWVEMTSALLTVAVRLREKEQIIRNLSSLLLLNREGKAWKNSRDTAMAVLALSEEMQYLRESKGSSLISISLNGGEARQFTISPSDMNVDSGIVLYRDDSVVGKNTITISKKGGPPLYATSVAFFTDRSSSFKKTDQGFDIVRSYYRMEGERNLTGSYSFNSSEAKEFSQGDLVMVELKVTIKSDPANYIMIEDPLPAGFSVIRNDSDYFSSDYNKEYSSLQIFNERTAIFIPNTGDRSDTYTLRYFFRANIPGSYKAAPARGSMMYYPHVFGFSADDTLKIR